MFWSNLELKKILDYDRLEGLVAIINY